jgi:hypothetical protein
MVTLLLEFSLPFIFALAFLVIRLLLDLSRPVPRALGSVLPKFCVVNSDEIQRYNKTGKPFGEDNRQRSRVRRELRWKQICVNWGYLRQMTWNTRLIQQVVRFEIMKIDPSKSGLAYEPQEQLALELVEESAKMRQQLFRWQLSLLLRAILRLNIDHRVLIALLAQYKQLEQEIVNLAGMAEDDCYRQMLIERLGLNNWGLIEGGSAEPA